MAKLELWQLRQRQGLSLEEKIEFTKMRIRQWHEHWIGNTYVAFSGGKDSTVLLHIVRSMYPNTPAVFANTGLEYPEINEFVKTIDNVTYLRPNMNFKETIEKYGYPVVSKRVAKQLTMLKNPTENNKATRKLYWDGVKRMEQRQKH